MFFIFLNCTSGTKSCHAPHIECEVTLPKQNFVVTANHALITSVIGNMKMNKSKDLFTNGITFLGLMHVVIRSRKHSVSFTFHKLCNVTWIRFLSEFGNNFQSQREYRKVVIATIDGGPDEIRVTQIHLTVRLDIFSSRISMHHYWHKSIWLKHIQQGWENNGRA